MHGNTSMGRLMLAGGNPEYKPRRPNLRFVANAQGRLELDPLVRIIEEAREVEASEYLLSR